MELTKFRQNNGLADYRSGVVAIVGPPNAGKSTLLNYLLGQKISIVSHKPQTTRNRIAGIVTSDTYQIILLDTPGLHKARDLMNQEMVKVALDSVDEADVVLFVEDSAAMSHKQREKVVKQYREYFSQIRVPAVLALNKSDLIEKEALLPLTQWFVEMHGFDAVMPVCALDGEGTQELIAKIVSFLPEGPQYYPDDIPTDASERFIVAEIIREKIFLLTKEEVPYSTAVVIDSFQETDDSSPIIIHATILVERGSQKGILIGAKGRMLAKIRKQATSDIEKLLGCSVRLHLWLKVRKKWTENESMLRELGLK
ncbi:GTPase Era [Desulfogranum japonicum]|uniref:GTPase Era n=1 Tax=Desulfogranum japonicum TaxID=231447 RepID=UPI00042749CB|nr:GTPase Era [Desulfogranum japonicum]